MTTKKLFLIDGAGAAASAFFLIAISMRFQSAVGMPAEVLHALAAVACVFAVYSISCFLFLIRRLAFYLKIIAVANGAYCLMTLGAVVYYFDRLTALGLMYFGIEILVIVFLVVIEVGVVRRDRGEAGHLY